MKRHLPWFALAATLAALLASAVQAQPMYRIVGPDGRVTFSDRPPADGNAAAPAPGTTRAPAADTGAGLPFELRQIAARYPVTLYTAPSCAPCNSARNLLVNRGIPFTERTVTSNQDIDALQRISGEANLPFGTIGSQQLKGFADVEWTQYLDAAGYPRTSQLPPGYRAPAAAPLVAVQNTPAAAPAGNAPAPAGTPLSPPEPAPLPPSPAPRVNSPNPANPAGIRF